MSNERWIIEDLDEERDLPPEDHHAQLDEDPPDLEEEE